jgi:hypothetical protein
LSAPAAPVPSIPIFLHRPLLPQPLEGDDRLPRELERDDLAASPFQLDLEEQDLVLNIP